MLIGIFLFGWSATELMLFYWIEPIVSILLKGYLNIYIPSRISWNESIKKKLYLWLATFFGMLIVQGFILYGIISFNIISPKPMPWSFQHISLILLIPLIYIMPIYAQKKQGFLPIEENLPLQIKISLAPIQFISTYIILGITLGVLFYTKALWIGLLFLILSKMSIELMLFFRFRKKISSTI